MNDEDIIEEESPVELDDTPIEGDDDGTPDTPNPGPQRFDLSHYGCEVDD